MEKITTGMRNTANIINENFNELAKKNPYINTLLDKADLNNCKATGFYVGAGISGVLNKPNEALGNWFTLLVQGIGATNCSQIYFDTNTAQLFIRKLSNSNEWGKWVWIADSNGLILQMQSVINNAYWLQTTDQTTWNTTKLMGRYFIPAWQWLDKAPFSDTAYIVEISGNYNQWLQEAFAMDYTKKPLYRVFDGSYWTEWQPYKN